MDIAAWLEGLGLGRYAPAFRDNDVDAEVLPRLTADDLIGLGVASVGHRRKLLDAIAALRAGDTAAPSASAGLPAPSPPPAHRPRGAERRQLTVMFADLVGSTALSARLDPEEMGQVLRAYQDAVAGAVARFGGHVAKLMGDGVLAYFGWPRAHEDDAERAVLAGLTALQAIGRLRTPGRRDLGGEGRHRHRAGRDRRPGRRGRGPGGGGRRRHAQPRGPAADPGAARYGPDRTRHAAADRRRVRARRSRASGAEGPRRPGAGLARHREALGREPVRGARDRPDALGRAGAGGRPAARPLAAGQGRRGPDGSAVGRAGRRQVPHRPDRLRARRGGAAPAAALPVLALPHQHRLPPLRRAARARGGLRARRRGRSQAGQAGSPAGAGDGARGRGGSLARGDAVDPDRRALSAAGPRARAAAGADDRGARRAAPRARPAAAGAVRLRGSALGRPQHARRPRPGHRSDRLPRGCCCC